MKNYINAMTDTEKQAWEQIRAKGHGRFIVSYGLVRRGIPFGCVLTLNQILFDDATRSTTASGWILPGTFVLMTVLFGYGMGETEWRKRERAYRDDRD